MSTDLGFEWAGFISYRSGNEELTQTFIEQFCKALNNHLEPYFGGDLKIYLDRERLKGGDFFNQEIAVSLCKSLCMIMIFTPSYFDEKHRYCAREYKAMEILEQQRLVLSRIKSGLIIPVVFRGLEYLPDNIKNNRMYCDFTKYTLCSRELVRNKNFTEKIDEIARKIYSIYKDLEKTGAKICGPCSSFKLPDEYDPEVDRLVLKQKLTQPFPGRM